MPSLESMSALLNRVNLHWFTSMSRAPDQTFRNVIQIFSLYLYLFVVSTLLHTKEDLNSYPFLSLLLLTAAFLGSCPQTLSSLLRTVVDWFLRNGFTWITTLTSTRTWPSASIISFWFMVESVGQFSNDSVDKLSELSSFLFTVSVTLHVYLTGAEDS